MGTKGRHRGTGAHSWCTREPAGQRTARLVRAPLDPDGRVLMDAADRPEHLDPTLREHRAGDKSRLVINLGHDGRAHRDGSAQLDRNAKHGRDREATPCAQGDRDVGDAPPNTNLAATRLARRGATSGRGKCQPPAAGRGGAATETSSPSRRRSPKAWATQNTRRSRKHEEHEARAVSPALLYGAAAAPSGRGANNLNTADRPDGATQAGEHWLGRNRLNVSGNRPRGLVAAGSARPARRRGVRTRRCDAKACFT